MVKDDEVENFKVSQKIIIWKKKISIDIYK